MRGQINKESVLKLLKSTDEAGKTAFFYGFLPVVSPSITKSDLDFAKDLDEAWHPAEKMAILREYLEVRGSSLPQPLMLYYEKPFSGSGERKKHNKTECELVILGSQRSVCEAILIQAARAILENMGWKDTFVRINSVGSKESIFEFEKKMSGFIRKRIAEFTPELRQLIRKDTFFLTKTKDGKYKEWAESAPQSVDYLSELSRIHLKELLEFMEMIDLPYTVDCSLMGDMKYCTETVFEIVANSPSGEEILARGSRWNRLSKMAELKRELPAVSVSIEAKNLKSPKVSVVKPIKSKFYLVQFGPEAKQKSFIVLEKLRKAGIHISHSLAKDKLTGQIFSVEQLGIPYIILIGQKEAIDNVVVIRNIATRAQYVVPISELGEFIKRTPEFK